MWIETPILKEDLDSVCSLEYISWEKLTNKTIMVTGATGLIGTSFISALIYADIVKKLNLKIYALVRNKERAEQIYKHQLKDSNALSFIVGDVENIPNITGNIDYIIHAASPTASGYFIEKPVETIKTAVLGTLNILELAKQKKVAGMVYLSSMEIYGSPKTEDALKEENVGYIDPLVVRNCYPEAKRQCEALCAAYAGEYNIPAVSVRLAQTFGPGVEPNDSRVFAEFARCVMNHTDIVLLTKGTSKRCYLYTMDAVSAILTALLKGEPGQAYNAANQQTYCSIYEMAQEICTNLGKNLINVKIELNEKESKKFSPPHFYNLDTTAIRRLGWSPTINLMDMYERMIAAMQW